MENSGVRVLLVPFPVSPLVAFAYYFLGRHLGLYSPNVEARYSEGDSHNYFEGGKIGRLDRPDLHNELESLIGRSGYKKKYLLRRLLDWCAYSPKKEFGWRLLKSYSSMSDPKSLLESTIPFFEECLRSGRDFWRTGWNDEQDGNFFPTPVSAPVETPPGLRAGKFPVLKSDERAEREVVKAGSYELKEGRLMSLKNERIGCAVIGDRSIGKSTFARALFESMREVFKSVTSHRGPWENFPLEITLEDLDLGTPTQEALKQGFAQDREKMQALKRPWTMELAIQAFEEFSKAKAKPGIVIADSPGKATRFSELAVSCADVGVMVVNREEEAFRWRTFADNLGIKLVGEVRSCRETERVFSVITRYRQGQFVSGRVAGMNRADFSGDACVSHMAEFLLLDILPSRVEQRIKEIGDRLIIGSKLIDR